MMNAYALMFYLLQRLLFSSISNQHINKIKFPFYFLFFILIQAELTIEFGKLQ